MRYMSVNLVNRGLLSYATAEGKLLQGEWSNAVMIVLKDLFFAFMGMSPYRYCQNPLIGFRV